MPPTAHRLVFTGKQQVSLDSFDPGLPKENQVLVRTHLSLMSTGTENIVFNRLFDPGTHWDNWVKYPFYPGYVTAGEVVSVGAEVKRFRPGQRVAYRSGHCSHAVLAEDRLYPIPDSLPLDRAIWFPLAKIAFHGALAGRYGLGDRLAVIGAGPIGQMAARWANAAGAHSVVVVDTAEARLRMALAGGATAAVGRPIDEAGEEILAALDGKLPDTITDSTGNAAVFSACLGLVKNRGRVVLLGDTGQPSQQRLTNDVVTRGVTIVGTHDTHNTPEWNAETISSLFFRLATTGRFSLDGLNTHRFAPGECEKAYRVVNEERARTMGVLFDWTDGTSEPAST